MTYRIVAAALAGLVATTPVRAEQLWGQSGAWDIYAEPGVGCFIERNESDGGMRLGLDIGGQTGFIAFISPNFDDIVPGEAYDIEFFLDGQSYTGVAEAFEIGGTLGYHLEIDNPDFVYDVAARYTLEMIDEGISVVRIDLNGSNQALGGAAECTDSL